MQRDQHVRLSLLAGMGIMSVAAQAFGLSSIADIVMVPAVMAGAAEWNDIDAQGSSVYRAFPPVTIPVHLFVVWLDRAVYFLTRRPSDAPLIVKRTARKKNFRIGTVSWLRYGWRQKRSKKRTKGLLSRIYSSREFSSSHRRFAHSFIFCFLTGLLVWWLCSLGPWWVLAVFVSTVGLAGELIFAGPVFLLYVILTLAHYGAEGSQVHVVELAPVWGLAVGAGMIMHLVGDQCTHYGIPWLAPLTWRRFHLPVSFRTGGFVELRIVKWFLVLGCCYTGFLLFSSLI